MDEFRELCDRLQTYLTQDQIHLVEKAYLLGKEAHKHQRRSSGEPYITHPLEVAQILADMHMDQQTIIAAILHDVIEDTPIEKSRLQKDFGHEVAELVDGVSKLTQIQFETRAEMQAANFRKMMMAMTKDIRVIIIKLADRLHNMRTLTHLPPQKRHRIARETLEIYAPIANRLGMRTFRDEFHKLGFLCLYPLRYAVLERAVKKARGNRGEIIHKIEDGLKESLAQAGVKEFRLYGREKNLYSIYKKMRDKHLRLSEIMDVYGFRIVVDSVDLCYRALGAVHNLYKPVPERFKDYIAISKMNGYQSLHTTLFGPYGLPIEIQIRTNDMDKMAENGIAAHWLYKSDDPVVNQAQIRAREWIKGVLEIQNSTGDSLEFVENVKIDLFPDEVYVFTPQGDIMELPGSATAVDFAYAVHSDVGNGCIAARIDKRLVPLSTIVKSGQTIEIITAPGASPNPAWLNFVATGKARSNIRHYLKKQQHNEAVDLGQRLLGGALSGLGAELESITDTRKETVAQSVGCESFEILLAEIGLGNQMPQIVAQRLLHDNFKAELTEAPEHKDALVIKGTEGMAVNFADCCYPIPGDPVIGVLAKGQGIAVHTANCPRVVDFCQRFPEKYIPVRWEDDLHSDFRVAVNVQMKNQRGTLATLALAVSDAESNIEDISVHNSDGRYADIRMTVAVTGRSHLARVIRRIRQIPYVMRISRFKK